MPHPETLRLIRAFAGAGVTTRLIGGQAVVADFDGVELSNRDRVDPAALATLAP